MGSANVCVVVMLWYCDAMVLYVWYVSMWVYIYEYEYKYDGVYIGMYVCDECGYEIDVCRVCVCVCHVVW